MLEDRAGQRRPVSGGEDKQIHRGSRKSAGNARVSTTFLPAVPQVYVHVDRDKVSKQGVELAHVYKTLQTFMGGLFVNYFNRFGRQWQVYVQAEGDYRTDAQNLGQFYVRNNNGTQYRSRGDHDIERAYRPRVYDALQPVPLRADERDCHAGRKLASSHESAGGGICRRRCRLGWDSIIWACRIRKKWRNKACLASSDLWTFVALRIFNSCRPVRELGAAIQRPAWHPDRGVWSVRGLLVCGLENNIYAQIGLMMLIGLSAKNAILIVEFAKEQYGKGKDPAEAALEGARLRLRPILMTSFAFILGCVPLAVASGAGSIARRVMGIGVIGGMLTATCIAILFIPMMFYVIEKRTSRGKKDKQAGEKGERDA